MKNLSFQLLLGLLLLLPFSLFSQHRLESDLNMYRADDLLLKQQVEYKEPGRSGKGVLWDFSNLSVVSEDYEVSYFLSLRNPLFILTYLYIAFRSAYVSRLRRAKSKCPHLQ